MAAKLLTAHKQKIKSLVLVPAGGGCFELTANGELLYSKLNTGTFPDESAVVESVRAKLGA